MKLLIKLLIMLLFLFSIVMGQEYRHEALIRQAIASDSFYVDFFLRNVVPPTVKIGNSTFCISYNPSALQFIGKVSSLDGPWDNGMNPQWYNDLTVTNLPEFGRISINVGRIDLFPPDGGFALPTTRTRLGTLKFLIKNPSLERNINWIPTLCAISDYSGYIPLKGFFQFLVDQTVVAVELVSFVASSVDGYVQLNWVTKSERDNLGFNILRSESEKGEYKKINSKIISGAGNSEKENNYIFQDYDVEANRTYYYKLQDIDYVGRINVSDPIMVQVIGPDNYELKNNYPNPFNTSTTISFKIKEEGLTILDVYNVKGQKVRSLIHEKRKAGLHKITWDGTDNNGIPLPSGIYLYELQVNGYQKSHKMQLLR